MPGVWAATCGHEGVQGPVLSSGTMPCLDLWSYNSQGLVGVDPAFPLSQRALQMTGFWLVTSDQGPCHILGHAALGS